MAYYNEELSFQRVEILRNLCIQENFSALVFILGIDSRRNKVDDKVFFWLFKGITGYQRL